MPLQFSFIFWGHNLREIKDAKGQRGREKSWELEDIFYGFDIIFSEIKISKGLNSKMVLLTISIGYF